MRILMVFVVVTACSFKLLAQDCFVAVDSLKGQYTGDCKKGKANGTGTAKGRDTYTGSFKNGYPDGMGKYTWANGSSYEGNWKNGLFNGEGILTTINNEEKDSVVVVNGFWKKGKFINTTEHPAPFKIVALTNNISDYNMRKLSGTEGQITVIVKSITGGAQTTSSESPTIDVPVLSSLQLVEGTYNGEVADERPTAKFNKYIFRHVTFPFSAILSFKMPSASISSKQSVQQLSIDIPQNGNYYLEVNLDE